MSLKHCPLCLNDDKQRIAAGPINQPYMFLGCKKCGLTINIKRDPSLETNEETLDELYRRWNYLPRPERSYFDIGEEKQ